MTATATRTITGAATPVPTETNTPTPTIDAFFVEGPVLYPNPLKENGPTRLVLGLTSQADVTWELYTASFRKIGQGARLLAATGDEVLLEAADAKGSPLANGLYWIVVEIGPRARTLPWIVLR
jgi:hypothetical protein